MECSWSPRLSFRRRRHPLFWCMRARIVSPARAKFNVTNLNICVVNYEIYVHVHSRVKLLFCFGRVLPDSRKLSAETPASLECSRGSSETSPARRAAHLHLLPAAMAVTPASAKTRALRPAKRAQLSQELPRLLRPTRGDQLFPVRTILWDGLGNTGGWCCVKRDA